MKNIITSGLVFIIGNVLIQGLAFLTLPIYTRILSQEVYGQFSLYTSWVSMVSLIIGLQLGGSLASGWVKYGDKFSEFVSTIMVGSSVFFVCILAIVFVFAPFFAELFSFEKQIVFFIFVQAYLGTVQGLLAVYLMQVQKTLFNLCLSFGSALVNIILSLILIYQMENDFLARVLANALVTAIFGIFAMLYLYRTCGIHWNMQYWKFALQVSVPLIFHNLGHYVLHQFDRIMIGKMLTASDLALYSFAYSLVSILQIAISNLNTVWCPWYFERKRDGVKELSVYIYRYLSIGCLFVLGFIIIYPELALWLGGAKYTSGRSMIPFLVSGIFFMFLYSFPANIQYYSGNTKFLPIGTLITGACNILLNYIMIPVLGIYGAALATTISYIILLCLHYYMAKTRFGYTEIPLSVFIVVACAVCTYIGLMLYWQDILWLRFVSGGIILCVYGYYYRGEWVGILQRIRNKRSSI